MSLWIEKKFAKIVGLQLPMFKVTKESPFQARFRCVVCGDSQKSKFKTRGHFYEKKGHIGFHCFNCSASKTLSSFLFEQSPHLYKEFKIESLKEDGIVVEPFQKEKKEETFTLKGLKKVSQLPLDHKCRVYCDGRKIPFSQHYRLFYSEKFFHWINSLVPNKFSEETLKKDSPRLVIPFFDENNVLFGVQGRSLDNNTKLRYITVMFIEDKPKIYGLEKLNKDQETFIVEGPIDSLYLKNCLALAGSDGNFENLVLKNNTIIVLDNEPRNKEITTRMDKYISNGWRVCIWPEDLPYKDISDIVQAGLNPAEILSNNTFSGLEAKMKFVQWRRK